MYCTLEPMPCIKMKIEKIQFENREVSSMNSFLTILLMARGHSVMPKSIYNPCHSQFVLW